MKNRLFHFIILILTGGACTLPDVTTQNPPRLLDSPAFNVTPSGTGQATANGKTGYDGKTIGTTYITYGSSVDFAIDVVDCPGKVASVTSSISVPTYSTGIAVDASSLVGQETGSAKVNVKAMAAPDGTDRAANLALSVTDAQISTDGNAPKTTTVTWPVVLVKCVGTGIAAGNYQVTAASGVLDGGAPYSLADLEAAYGDNIVMSVIQNRPGLYTIADATGGVWASIYTTRALPTLAVDLCGTTVSGHEGLLTVGAIVTSPPSNTIRTFTLNGTLNSDNTITIVWSYVKASAPPAIPAHGTYTLTKI
jgi:hypothetical protein